MATLEKIRSKSVLLIVVIGVALLAFIIGDAITNSRNLFGDNTTVAKVGGTKIEYNDYVRKREELNSQLEQARKQNPLQYSNYDTQLLSQMAVDQLMGEALLKKHAEDAGIQTSPSQLSFFMLEQPINPRINEFLQQLAAAGYNFTTPTQAYELIFYPQRQGIPDAEMEPYRRYWVALEAETREMIKSQTYVSLLQGTFKANDLDKKAFVNDYQHTKNVELAYKPYTNFNEDKYAPADNELRSEYDKVKGEFKVDELTKEIAFIAVNIGPSEADQQEASKLAQQTAEALKTGNANLNKDLRKEGVVVTHRQLKAENIYNAALKEFVTTAPADSVTILSENIKGFTVVKVGPKKVEVDSIQLNTVQVVGTTLPEKALLSLNQGLAIDSLASVYSADSVFVQKEQWVELYNAQGQTSALTNAQLDSLMNANGKFVTLLSGPQGSVLGQISKKSAPKTIYEFDEVNYELKPSTITVNDARTKLEDFLTANESAKLFIENAPKEGYSVINLSLNSSTPAVPRFQGAPNYFPDSRQVVRWVMIDGKTGEVSHVYESKDAMSPALYAVAVLSEYDDYVPLTNNDVRKYVEDKVRKSKVGDELLAGYQGKANSVQNVATAMGVEPRTEGNFRFAKNQLVREDAVTGQIAGSKPGNVILVKGDNGIYAYRVISEGVEQYEPTDADLERRYNEMLNIDLGEMFKGAQNFKNNIYKFEAGD